MPTGLLVGSQYVSYEVKRTRLGSVQVIMQHFAFSFFTFQAGGGGGREAFPVAINIWSLLPCKQMHCTASQLFYQRIGLRQQTEFSRIADIYPKQCYTVLSSKSLGHFI